MSLTPNVKSRLITHLVSQGHMCHSFGQLGSHVILLDELSQPEQFRCDIYALWWWNMTGFRVLERLGPRSLSGHLRTFADYLVYEFSTSAGGQHVNKCVEALNDLIWKCNIVSIDRLVLCLVRSHSGSWCLRGQSSWEWNQGLTYMNDYLAVESGEYLWTNSLCRLIAPWLSTSPKSQDCVWFFFFHILDWALAGH